MGRQRRQSSPFGGSKGETLTSEHQRTPVQSARKSVAENPPTPPRATPEGEPAWKAALTL